MSFSHSNNQNTKSCKLSQISDILCRLYAYIERFYRFIVFVHAKGSLRDLRYFFSTNNLRLVKSFLEISNESFTLKSSKHENHEIWVVFRVFVSIVGIYWTLLGIKCFCPSTSRSAGSQKNFLDKWFETCQKFSWDLQWVSHTEIIKTWKSRKWAIFQVFCVDYRHILNVFGNFIFLTKQRVLCEISDIFPRQTIWDLSKIFLTTSMCLSHWNHQKHENALLVKFPIYLMSILCIYWTFLRISHFCPSTSRSAGSQIFFSRQTIWDLLKIFMRSSMSLSHWNHQNTKITFWPCFHIFCVDSRHILNVFEKLMFLSKHESLCGISNIFSRQTIWDLLNIFFWSPMSLPHWNC